MKDVDVDVDVAEERCGTSCRLLLEPQKIVRKQGKCKLQKYSLNSRTRPEPSLSCFLPPSLITHSINPSPSSCSPPSLVPPIPTLCSHGDYLLRHVWCGLRVRHSCDTRFQLSSSSGPMRIRQSKCQRWPNPSRRAL